MNEIELAARSTASNGISAAELDRREVFCREIVCTAGDLVRKGFATRNAGRFDMKGPQDFLTETDTEVERHLRDRIGDAFPQDGFLGEETGGVVKDATWVVDPLDGTANFARGVPHFCVSIALVAGSETWLGAIYNVGFDELYFARKGHGATRNDQPIEVSATSRLDAATVELGWSNRRTNEAYVGMLAEVLDRGANARRCSSGALGLAYVADGRSDAYAELHMHAWDCLAGLLLVREAGGSVAPFPTPANLSQGGAVLAATPAIAETMSELSGISLND